MLSGKKDTESCEKELESDVSTVKTLKGTEAIFASIFPSSASKASKIVSPT